MMVFIWALLNIYTFVRICSACLESDGWASSLSVGCTSSIIIGFGSLAVLAFIESLPTPYALLGYCVILLPWILILLPQFIKDFHYWAIPHPLEQHIPTVGRDGVPERIDVPSFLADVPTPDLSNLPPAWVSSNQEKRLKAAREVIKAQTELMQEVIRHTKSRDYIDDQK